MAGAKKRKASKKKTKKSETLDSNNQHQPNDSSIGSVDESKLEEERDSDGAELEREEEEEEILDQLEVDIANDEGLEQQVVEIASEEKSLLNGSGSPDFTSVDAAEENPVAVPASEEDSVAATIDLQDKEVAVVEEDEKLMVAQYEELKEESTDISALDDKEAVDVDEEEAVVESNEPVEPQIVVDDEEDLVKEEVKLVPEEVVSAVDESFVMPAPPAVVDSELTQNEDSSFLQVSDQTSVIEAEKSEQIEDTVEVVPQDDEEKSSEAPAVSNGVANGGKPLETDNQEAAVVINTSREVDNGKQLEIQNKPLEDQPLIGSNPLPLRKTSWTGCCGLFEVFSSANR